MMQQTLVARPQQIAEEVARLARSALGSDIEVIWFGSWPKGTAHAHADIDIAVAGSGIFPPERFAELRTLVDAIATLHDIDLVDLHAVGETLKEEILRHGIRL